MENSLNWYAIKTKQDMRAEKVLNEHCNDIFFPKREVSMPGKHKRVRSMIPHVMFVHTTHEKILELEKMGKENPINYVQFWIYRYPKDNKIQVIPQQSIELLNLLTASDTTRCEIFNKTDFKENQRVRVTGGPFKGYEGSVQRVRKNRHVIVRIEGICLVMLPYIHPDLLETIDG